VYLTYSIRAHKDGTITVKVGRQVEHISSQDKTPEELWQAIKWAAISKGVPSDSSMLIDIRNKLRSLGR
jgi:hypothetical protein